MRPLRHLFSVLSPGGDRGALSVFLFHRVWPVPDTVFVNEPDVRRFREVLSWIAAWFHVLPLDEAVQRLRQGQLPPRAAAITFDDGYADNFTQAFPLLREQGLCATFFIADGFLDGGSMWNDVVIEAVKQCPAQELDLARIGLGRYRLENPPARHACILALLDQLKYLPEALRKDTADAIADIAGVAIPDTLMMTSDQVRALVAGGMQIGSHTSHHPILAQSSPRLRDAEIAGSKARLEGITGNRVSLFAYPNGKPGADFGPGDVEAVRRLGFDAAFTTAPGVGRVSSDLMQLPRFTPWDRSRWRFAAKLAGNYFVR